MATHSTEWAEHAQVLTALGSAVKRLERHTFVLEEQRGFTNGRTDLHVWGDEHQPYMTVLMMVDTPSGNLESSIYLNWTDDSFSLSAEVMRWTERTDEEVTLWLSEMLSGTMSAELEGAIGSLVSQLEAKLLDMTLDPGD